MTTRTIDMNTTVEAHPALGAAELRRVIAEGPQ